MDRSAYLILAILKKFEAVHSVRGLTVNEIAEKEKISRPNTIYKKIKVLQKAGYPCFVINSSQEDLDTLVGVAHKLYFQNKKAVIRIESCQNCYSKTIIYIDYTGVKVD